MVNIRNFFRITGLIICWLILSPIFILYIVQSWFTKSERFYSDATQLMSLIPGTLGNHLRKAFYKFFLKKCGNVCCISFGTIISHPQAEVGENVYIGANCMIGTVTIEEGVLIGSNVDIIDGKRQHNFDSLDVPIRNQKRNIERIRIGKESWIGNSAVILANIGEYCVIGAGSVVVDDIRSLSVAVGNPARIVKKRK